MLAKAGGLGLEGIISERAEERTTYRVANSHEFRKLGCSSSRSWRLHFLSRLDVQYFRSPRVFMNLVVNARDAMAEGVARVNLDEDDVRNTLRFGPADI